MTLNDLADLGQVIGAIAVVISLIYVALQIRQNTSAIRAATAQSVHEHFASWYCLLASDGELSQVLIAGLKDYASLSEKDKGRFVCTFMAFLSYSQNAFMKWRQGLPAPSLWMVWEHHELYEFPRWPSVWKERAYLSAKTSAVTSKTAL